MRKGIGPTLRSGLCHSRLARIVGREIARLQVRALPAVSFTAAVRAFRRVAPKEAGSVDWTWVNAGFSIWKKIVSNIVHLALSVTNGQ